ncbi:MAG: hypothetical protein Q8Q39_03770, partial [bacterium]|nr:hypothetical protein [bacterium]
MLVNLISFMMQLSKSTKQRFARALSVTTTITTTLWMSGAALLAPIGTHAQSVTINDGDIFRASNDFKVYIAKH